ncbi:SUF system Fe-S cluster assembly protein [Aurantimonas sp. A2-1-M11]
MTDQADPKPAADDTAAANVAMASGDGGTQSAIPAEELTRLTDDIVGALKTVYDPEIPADIYELGLIYKIDIDDERNVDVQMTLTAPGCPVAGEMPIWVENAVSSVDGVGQVRVDLVFDPPWTPERMSEEAQVAVGWF